ncbi:hypothetical protein E2C01_005258 [Portunus trituberculatus]|uniref:Uncharacterized protein n=1 Tax=Portunus trituberculatus TaxID=210409 RepID=A0A5B7CTT1_PORTR|nr:hypothetical protein [Portunus trituberculatus]
MPGPAVNSAAPREGGGRGSPGLVSRLPLGMGGRAVNFGEYSLPSLLTAAQANLFKLIHFTEIT